MKIERLIDKKPLSFNKKREKENRKKKLNFLTLEAIFKKSFKNNKYLSKKKPLNQIRILKKEKLKDAFKKFIEII